MELRFGGALKKIILRNFIFLGLIVLIILCVLISTSYTLRFTDNSLLSGLEKTDLIENIGKIRNSLILLRGVILLMISLSIGLIIAHLLKAGKGIDRMNKIIDMAQAIADGDLTQEDIKATSKDGMGRLADALNRMKHNLSSVAAELSGTINQLTHISQNLSVSSMRVDTSTRQQILLLKAVAYFLKL